MNKNSMKKFCCLLSLLVVSAFLGGCFKNVYIGADEDDPGKKEDTGKPDGAEEPLPDLSVPEAFDWSEVSVRIPVADGVRAEDVRVYFPRLKYGKKFVYSYTYDDCTAMAYGRGFSLINKKWIDAEKFFHVNQDKSTGYLPVKTLGYTDGCGNEHRFGLGLAIWPALGNSNIDNFMNPVGKYPDKYYPYAVWKDVVPLIDFGGEIYFHDVDTGGEDTVEAILKGLKSSQEVTNQMLGRKMKVLARANGDEKYCEAGRRYEDIVLVTAGGYTSGSFPQYVTFDTDIDLRNQTLFRRNVESTPDVGQLWPSIAKAASGDKYMWVNDFSHGVEEHQFILDLFTKINDEYGKDGEDIVWFATLDEVYEYDYLRKNIVIEKTVADNVLTLTFSCLFSGLADEFMFHRDFSLILEGKGLLFGRDAGVSSGSNVYGLSYAETGDDTWLMNVDCNRSLQDRAERYIARYEKWREASDKEDALYFINLLKKELKADYLDRIK